MKDNNIHIQLYGRYVDDINVIAKSTPRENGDDPPDKRTMLRIQQLANTIHDSIRVTVDYPSNNDNGRIPVLDLVQWLQVVDVNGECKQQIVHSHYSKPISSKHVINKASALSMSSKMNILTSDLMRIMRNVSELCGNEERDTQIQRFMFRLQYSGYSQSERVEVYKKAKRRFVKLIQDDRDGLAPLYRSKFYNQKQREETKKENVKNGTAKEDTKQLCLLHQHQAAN